MSVLLESTQRLLRAVKPLGPLFPNAMVADAFAVAHTRGQLTVLPTTDGAFVLFDRDARLGEGVRGRFDNVKAAHAALEAAA